MKTPLQCSRFLILGATASLYCMTRVSYGDEGHKIQHKIMGEHITMMDGKPMVVKGNEKVMMKEDRTLRNGTTIMTDGTVVLMDGAKMVLEDGDGVSRDGTVIKSGSANPDAMREGHKKTNHAY